jgi:hypothetical protein
LLGLIEYVELCLVTAQGLVEQGGELEERLATLEIPQKYRAWKFPRFYQSNLRFLCQRSLS